MLQTSALADLDSLGRHRVLAALPPPGVMFASLSECTTAPVVITSGEQLQARIDAIDAVGEPDDYPGICRRDELMLALRRDLIQVAYDDPYVAAELLPYGEGETGVTKSLMRTARHDLARVFMVGEVLAQEHAHGRYPTYAEPNEGRSFVRVPAADGVVAVVLPSAAETGQAISNYGLITTPYKSELAAATAAAAQHDLSMAIDYRRDGRSLRPIPVTEFIPGNEAWRRVIASASLGIEFT